MTDLVNKLKDQGIKEIMLSARTMKDIQTNLEFIKKYNHKKEEQQ